MLSFLPLKPSKNPFKEIWHESRPDLVRIASAFASETGVTELREKIVGKETFDPVPKQWLIGIQDGITQPKALATLGILVNSEVRIPFGSAVLADPSLKAQQFFHSKVFYFENSDEGSASIVSTSANLTLSGLRSNVEQVLVWSGDRGDPAAAAFGAWWNQLWTTADAVTEPFLTKYEAARPMLPVPSGVASKGPADSVLQEASSFWIELTRKPEGGAYNQLELLFNGHFFFYPDEAEPSKEVPRPLTFQDIEGNVYADAGRQIGFNGPPRRKTGNSMWRVYLPTLAMGFGDYQDGDVLVHFQRLPKADCYLVAVAPSESARAMAWIEESTVAEHPGPPRHRMGWA